MTDWRMHKLFCQKGIKTAPDNELTMSWHSVHEERLTQIAISIMESGAPDTLLRHLRTEFVKVSLIERDCPPTTASHNKLAFHKLEIKNIKDGFNPEDYLKWFLCNPPTCIFVYSQYSKFDHIRDPALTITSSPVNLQDYPAPFPPLKAQFDAFRSEISLFNSFDMAFPNLASNEMY
ncbi:hypothetical protein GALMADRAFT_206137 [Galerina marginata CBS 339.88]|uniref:Uncharacterized protein n=1 Tax=Galerina marginata (strain CBS 339.88) TaxID=685588 RepID=A0A067TZT4_GALM3|nr:hypothetical protein GALMADRAFT_206137 [Galerina marginata CBS 339.88]